MPLLKSPVYYAEKYKTSFMNMAYAVASNSVATRRKVGCVIYLSNHTISIGWNGQPSGTPTEDCEGVDGLTRGEVAHAEQNTLNKLPEGSKLLKGAILFCSTQPCLKCSKLIVDSGVAKVYYSEEYSSKEGKEYLQQHSIECVKI